MGAERVGRAAGRRARDGARNSRSLGPPPAWSIDEPMVTCLERVYRLTSTLARRLAVTGQVDREDPRGRRDARALTTMNDNRVDNSGSFRKHMK
jgi:hypothetical protein